MAAENPSPSDGHEHEHDEESCPKCWAALSTPLFCETCLELLEPGDARSPFETLGVQRGYELNAMALRKRLLALSRRMHPDFFAGADAATRARAQRNTAELNAAFEILSDEFRRADWLVRSLGGPGEDEERQLPVEFLSEVLEWNEAVEEARSAGPDAPAHPALAELDRKLRAEREAAMREISDMLSPLPDAHASELARVRRRLNAVRYLDRTLHEIAELKLAQASSR